MNLNGFWFILWQCNEIRKFNSNLTIIGKTRVDNDKEEFDNDADDDDADNADESEGDEFDQETGWSFNCRAVLCCVRSFRTFSSLCYIRKTMF